MLTRRAAILTTLGLGAAAAMPTSDDLTSLFTAQPDTPGVPLIARQGIIMTWNPINLENTVLVGRTIFQDLNVIGVGEVASFHEGVTVIVVSVNSSWAILGRFCIPGTDDAEDAITQAGQRAFTASVLTQENTNSAVFTDLATPGPSVGPIRIPASGKAYVTIGAQFDPVSSANPCTGVVGVEVSGDTSIAPDTHRSLLLVAAATATAGINATKVVPFEGLPAGGLCTFTLKYRNAGTGAIQFANRDITVEIK